jgi:hypothetical protein
VLGESLVHLERPRIVTSLWHHALLIKQCKDTDPVFDQVNADLSTVTPHISTIVITRTEPHMLGKTNDGRAGKKRLTWRVQPTDLIVVKVDKRPLDFFSNISTQHPPP